MNMLSKQTKQEIKKLWKPFVVLFVFSFLAVNWADVSWVFNYRAVSGILAAPFQFIGAIGAEENPLAADSENYALSESGRGSANYVSAEEAREDRAGSMTEEPERADAVKSQSIIQIPKIGTSAPIVFAGSSDYYVLHKLLDKGVVHYPDSALFGEQGQTIVLGHSAPPNWPKIKYDWVFSRLNELRPGDKIIVYYNNQRYVYSVLRKIFLSRGEEIPKNHLTDNKNVLISISCWPPGKNYKRIAVESVLID